MPNDPFLQVPLLHEDEARQILLDHYRGVYGKHADEQVDLLLALDGYIDRFNYLFSVMGARLKSIQKILISGYSAGSEMIVARQFGLQTIHGVEVSKFLQEATQLRLADLEGMVPALYDGSHLPYDDEQYDLAVSGHIIEHTQSPELYLSELMRVLKAGGLLYIEFPSRFHYIELHTGLLSFEWLPTFWRNAIYQFFSSPYSMLHPEVRSKYRSILQTRLKQISRGDIFRMLKRMAINYKELTYSVPAPGIVRCIIQKVSSNTSENHEYTD